MGILNEEIQAILIEIEQGNYEQGIEKLHNLDYSHFRLEDKVEVGKIYLALGFIDEARRFIDQVKAQSGESILDIKRIEAEIDYKEGNYDSAIGIMHDILENDQYDDYDFVFLSQVYFDDGLPEVSYRYIKKAIELNSNVPFYHYQKGLYAFEMGNTEEALKSFQEAVTLEYDEPLYHLALGEAYYSVGQFDEALEEYDEVLTQYPKQEEALYLKGLLLLQTGEVIEGIRHLNMVADLQPENLDILISLADAYERAHDLEHSQSVLEKILEKDEYFLPALKRLGEIYLYQENWEMAKGILNKAIEIDPDDISLQVMYAKILKAYGDVREAIEQFESIHQESPEEDICENLGDLYLKAGDVHKAIPCYEKQLQITQDPKIMNQLAACYAETKNYRKALTLIEQSISTDPSQEKLHLIKDQIIDLLKSQEN